MGHAHQGPDEPQWRRRTASGNAGPKLALGGVRHHYGPSVLICHHVDRGHDFLRCCLMYHVPCARNTSQGAVRNITMQMRRLLALDKPVFGTYNDGDRHLQQPVPFPESVGRRNHQSRFGSARSDLRRSGREKVPRNRVRPTRIWPQRAAPQHNLERGARSRGFLVSITEALTRVHDHPVLREMLHCGGQQPDVHIVPSCLFPSLCRFEGLPCLARRFCWLGQARRTRLTVDAALFADWNKTRPPLPHKDRSRIRASIRTSQFHSYSR